MAQMAMVMNLDLVELFEHGVIHRATLRSGW
jgi:hypothetical protein